MSNYLTFMHEGLINRNSSKQIREIKQYAKTEGISWWSLLNNKSKRKKKT